MSIGAAILKLEEIGNVIGRERETCRRESDARRLNLMDELYRLVNGALNEFNRRDRMLVTEAAQNDQFAGLLDATLSAQRNYYEQPIPALKIIRDDYERQLSEALEARRGGFA